MKNKKVVVNNNQKATNKNFKGNKVFNAGD